MRLELQIALSLLHRGARHSLGPDRSQVADLHLPAGHGPHPVAVLLHGGYWQTRHGRLVTRPLALDLARRGWAAWNLEYRRLGEGGGWPETFDDVAGGIDHLAALHDPRLDLERVTALGHSAGGQLALWAAARTVLPEGAPGASPVVAIRRAVAMGAVCSLEYGGRSAYRLVGGGPVEFPERWRQADPMAQVPLAVPVLLVHPVDDRTVSVEQSRAYAARGAAKGGDVTLMEPESGGHRAPIYPVTSAWLSAVDWLKKTDSQASSGTNSPFIPP